MRINTATANLWLSKKDKGEDVSCRAKINTQPQESRSGQKLVIASQWVHSCNGCKPHLTKAEPAGQQISLRVSQVKLVRSQMDQGCRLCIEPRKIYRRGLRIASRVSEMKADGVRKPEGSIFLHVMATVEVTTGVRDQGMHSQGRRENSGEDITVRKPLLTSRHISREDSPPPMRASCEGHKSRRVDKVPGADS